MKSFSQLVEEQAKSVVEIMPWDLEERLQAANKPLLLDVREPAEFDAMHIDGAINVPRGVLESASEYDYDETEPALVAARDEEVIVICRSGHRSVLAAFTLQYLGFKQAVSLKTGMRGWSDYEQPMIDKVGNKVAFEDADDFFETKLREDQINPARK
ncbi:MAG TPA: rhodanese-like domain-containing protein [Gammaproteobacteria bacterium]|jgi:rhodanese-related sulfurtransferase|nr:rhodanese-like domain-containing protein [Gammaproteobacteria bacterium]